MATATNALLELAYDAERDGYPKAAEAFRKLAKGTSDIPGEFTVKDMLDAIELVRALNPTTSRRVEIARQFDEVFAEPTYRDPASGDLTDDPACPLAYHDFVIGEDLTRVLIGPFDSAYGIELLIAGCQVGSSFADEPQLTFDQVRQIRDNLTALLEDARVIAALGDR